jgi:hypothetical protein
MLVVALLQFLIMRVGYASECEIPIYNLIQAPLLHNVYSEPMVVVGLDHVDSAPEPKCLGPEKAIM